MDRKFITFLVGSALLCGLLASCGGGNKAGGGAGEAVDVNGASITMNSGAVSRNTVKANFTVENKGSSDLVIDPATSFTVEAENEGEKVNMEVDPGCKSTQLAGTVPAGGTLTGDLCWRSDPTLTWPATAKIKYGTAVWEVKTEE